MSTSTSTRQSMTTSEMFSTFLGNLVISDRATISDRYERITSALNRKFRDTDSKTANSLQIGSYGRWTGIKGLSDLDMIYILPKGEWDRLKNDQYKALSETKKAIESTYPATSISVDRLVVVVKFESYVIEVQPCFEQEDGSFLYPDTYRSKWLPTMPREEMAAVSEMDGQTNGNLRALCKMARAWRNKHGLQMGGLLIDTLAYQFLGNTNDYDETSCSSHDQMVLDFFTYLSEEPTDKSHYKAPGSGQNVRIKKRFQKKAKKAVGLCQAAIDAAGQVNSNDKWRKVFGRPFPVAVTVSKSAAQVFAASATWSNTEEFIEDKYSVDIRYDLKIDCEVTQNGYRTFTLRDWLALARKLRASQSLKFQVVRIDSDLKGYYSIHWKVLNRGEKARQLNQVRGQIVPGSTTKLERCSFRGGHIVECYIIQNNVVVAKDRIDVPIDDSQSS
jgi:hypothetical protein